MMYKADSSHWKLTPLTTPKSRQSPEDSPVAGWLIERIVHASATRLGGNSRKFLQIGTGQWCAAEYATWFPVRSAAQVYAKEFGYETDCDVRLVWQRKS